MIVNLEQKIRAGTHAYTQCVEIGDGMRTSVITSLNEQTRMACESIKNHTVFGKQEFNIVGLS